MAIIVTTPEVSAVRDADRIVGLLEASELYEPQLIINRIRPDMIRKGDMMTTKDVIDILAIKLLGIVPDDESIIVSTNRGEPAVLDKKSLSGQAFRNIVRRLEGASVPFLPLEETSRFKRLLRLFNLSGSKS